MINEAFQACSLNDQASRYLAAITLPICWYANGTGGI